MREIRGVMVRDTLSELVDPAAAAIVVIDMQNDFCHPDGLFAKAGKDTTAIREMLPRAVSFVETARRLGVRVIFVQQTTLRDDRSDSPAYLRFKVRDDKAPDYTLEGTWGWQYIDEMNLRPDDFVVRKSRSDAFLHTNLDQVLRAARIETMVVIGPVTEGCVEATVRSGLHHDYYVVVVRDCVASVNKALHEGSMRLMEARHIMANSDELLAAWKAHAEAAGRA